LKDLNKINTLVNVAAAAVVASALNNKLYCVNFSRLAFS